MKSTKGFLFRVLSAGVLATGLLAAQDATQADNTKVNKGDASKTAATADHQSNAKQDRLLTQKIRQSLMQDKALSTYAHNIKIISQNGTVTLKGPVKSEGEKNAVESKAIDIAGGAGKVDDELTVKASK
jgi:hyperosmotically inducible protein